MEVAILSAELGILHPESGFTALREISGMFRVSSTRSILYDEAADRSKTGVSILEALLS